MTHTPSASHVLLPLAGQCIWLTRPPLQSDALEEALGKLGALTFALPLLEIQPVPLAGAALAAVQQLDRYQLVVWVSSNAARAGMEAIGMQWPQYPAHLINIAVGPTTAAVLEAKGLQVHYPRERMDSEGMLALPQLQDIQGKRALIVRGRGGRELMSANLRERGASVDYCELYKRGVPEYSQSALLAGLQSHPPTAIVVSSAEAMDNLKTLYQPWYRDWQDLPLHVVSQRLHDHAVASGFRRAVTMDGATDAAIIKGLLDVSGGARHE
ncbi:MAG TPA: uroporphyrinogen-III synthase [Pseudomonadaceae bacterium]|nr:uroporphyrinogen-III synthase [Pseudomonadaceae bacterium]